MSERSDMWMSEDRQIRCAISVVKVVVSIVSHFDMPIVARLANLIVASGSEIKVIVRCNVPEPCDLVDFRVVVVTNEVTRGFGENHNLNFELALSNFQRFNYFIVLNPDIHKTKEFDFHYFFKFIDEHDIACGSPVVIQDGVAGSNIKSSFPGLKFLPLNLCAHESFWLGGMFLVLNSELYKELGGFDERYFMYCEDVDLSMRVILSGRQLEILHNFEVFHEGRRKSRKQIKYFFIHIKSLFKFYTSGTFFRFIISGILRGHK